MYANVNAIQIKMP